MRYVVRSDRTLAATQIHGVRPRFSIAVLPILVSIVSLWFVVVCDAFSSPAAAWSAAIGGFIALQAGVLYRSYVHLVIEHEGGRLRRRLRGARANCLATVTSLALLLQEVREGRGERIVAARKLVRSETLRWARTATFRRDLEERAVLSDPESGVYCLPEALILTAEDDGEIVANLPLHSILRVTVRRKIASFETVFCFLAGALMFGAGWHSKPGALGWVVLLFGWTFMSGSRGTSKPGSMLLVCETTSGRVTHSLSYSRSAAAALAFSIQELARERCATEWGLTPSLLRS